MPIDDNPLILYVLMRTDLPDYSSGKSMAQANHAGTQFMDHCERSGSTSVLSWCQAWLRTGGGFGICVVVGCTYREMREALTLAGALNLESGLVHDPSYPIQDGDNMQHLPVDTCGWVFGLKASCTPVVGDMRLFREPK